LTTCSAAHAVCLPQCSISNAQFSLDGKTYTLQANDGSSCIHGWSEPWQLAGWQAAGAGSLEGHGQR
jgi:galactose mutarotase-like enzyme